MLKSIPIRKESPFDIDMFGEAIPSSQLVPGLADQLVKELTAIITSAMLRRTLPVIHANDCIMTKSVS